MDMIKEFTYNLIQLIVGVAVGTFLGTIFAAFALATISLNFS